MKPNEPDHMTEALRQSLARLERAFPVHAPSVAELENRLIAHRRTLRKRLIRDLTLFSCIALFVLALLFGLYAFTPILLIVVQAAAVTLAPFALLRLYRKRVSE